MLGTKVGSGVGKDEGGGVTVGCKVGTGDGKLVGVDDGVGVGRGVGCCVCVGRGVGAGVGTGVGCGDGAGVGLKVHGKPMDSSLKWWPDLASGTTTATPPLAYVPSLALPSSITDSVSMSSSAQPREVPEMSRRRRYIWSAKFVMSRENGLLVSRLVAMPRCRSMNAVVVVMVFR